MYSREEKQQLLDNFDCEGMSTVYIVTTTALCSFGPRSWMERRRDKICSLTSSPRQDPLLRGIPTNDSAIPNNAPKLRNV